MRSKRRVNGLLNFIAVLGVIAFSSLAGMVISPISSEAVDQTPAPTPEVKYIEVPVEVTVTPAPEISSETSQNENLVVTGFDEDTDYSFLIMEAAEAAFNAEDPRYALAMGDIYETTRNLKIDELGLEYAKTEYFTGDMSVDEIYYAIFPDRKKDYTEDDLINMAKIITNESGSDFIGDEHQQLVGSVLYNRWKSGLWGDTLYEVIIARGQYASDRPGELIKDRLPYMTYTERAYENAKYILEHGPICPENVLFQSNYASNGKGYYKVFYYPQLGTYTYFAYG